MQSVAHANDMLTQTIIGAEIRVHAGLGPGLFESVYEKCLLHELNELGCSVDKQKPVPIRYRNIVIEGGLRLDLLVNNEVIVELKAVDTLLPIHEAQLLTYLRLSGLHRGLLINFNVKLMKHGIRRLVNGEAE